VCWESIGTAKSAILHHLQPPGGTSIPLVRVLLIVLF
jgi:hypothetical protein